MIGARSMHSGRVQMHAATAAVAVKYLGNGGLHFLRLLLLHRFLHVNIESQDQAQDSWQNQRASMCSNGGTDQHTSSTATASTIATSPFEFFAI